MKVFLSWSGATSHRVACALREWLPSVIQSIVPYVSSEDIDKGARWSTDIAKELEDSRHGIICVTKDNLGAPWVNFEAGALSKIIAKSSVTPFLFDLKRSDVQGPLLQFQSTICEKDDILKLLRSINTQGTDAERLQDDKLSRAFEVWWPQLHDALKAIPTLDDDSAKPAAKTKEKSSEILEELLELARTQQRLLANPANLIPPDYLAFALDNPAFRHRRPNHRMDAHGRFHRKLLELLEYVHAHEKDTPLFREVSDLTEQLHMLFHDLERNAGDAFRPDFKRMKSALKNDAA